MASRRISAAATAPCSEVPQPVSTTGSPASRAAVIAVASRAAAEPVAASRSRMRPVMAGSAAIISVMWNGAVPRRLGISVEAHGSGGPGSGAVGSKSMDASIRGG